jgi:hypothetical protein
VTPNDFRGRDLRPLLDQAVGSVKFLADQRDLHQIALCQWICGKFTLADTFTDGDTQHEIWLCIQNNPKLDIVIEIARAEGTVMSAHWAEEVISLAASTGVAKTSARVSELILQYRDRRDRRLDG